MSFESIKKRYAEAFMPLYSADKTSLDHKKAVKLFTSFAPFDIQWLIENLAKSMRETERYRTSWTNMHQSIHELGEARDTLEAALLLATEKREEDWSGKTAVEFIELAQQKRLEEIIQEEDDELGAEEDTDRREPL